jgi:hypothetical protein
VLETIRDIAIIIIAILDIILLSLLALIAFFAFRIFMKVKHYVPDLLDTSKETLTTVKGTTDFVADRAITPIIRVTAIVTAVQRFFAVLFGGERRRVP